VTLRNIGLDIGKKEVALCEIRDGKVVSRRTLRGLHELKDVMSAENGLATVALEACREAWHVHDELTKLGHHVMLIDTTRVKRLGIGQHGRKSDRLDAECFARAVDEGRIPQAHVLSPERRVLREKLNARRVLVETRAKYITTIRGIIRARGEKLADCDTDHFRSKLASSMLSDEVRAVVAPLGTVLEVLDAQLSRVELELEGLCANDKTISTLTTSPGVNLIVAAVFVSVIDQAKRFRNAHKVESYLGLVPREDTTGGNSNRKLGSITKCGNAYARAVLVQAAWSILRGKTDDPLRVWAKRVASRRGKRIAVVALARRLAGILWAMWRDGQTYDSQRLARASSSGLKAAATNIASQIDAMKTIEHKAKLRSRAIRARGRQITPPKEVVN
jgi:transposase